jgi:hypothetical protein
MANTKVTGDLIASSTIATGNIADNAVTSDKISGITTAHITEGSNLYYTNARADARITAATTSDLSEGTNLYYTNARTDARVNLQTGANLSLSNKSTSDLSEGTNLYYTDARADARAALLVDSAPSTLNTLNELAAALGDDPNFATTVTNSIATKLPLAGGTLTGNLNAKNILFGTSALPAANNPGINLRDTNNEFYFQSGSAHIFNFIRYDNRNSMMNLESTGINVTGGGTFSGGVTGTIARFDTLNNNANSANIIYRSGTDTIVGGGSPPNKIYIQDSGNVGIGTALPTTALTVRKAIASQAYGEQASMVEFKSYYTGYDTETVKSAIYSGVSAQTTLQTTRGFMSFWTADYVSGGGQSLTEKMRIESDGFVRIGNPSATNTYTPAQGYVAGISSPTSGGQTYLSLSMGGSALGNTGVAFGLDAGGASYYMRDNKPIRFYTNNTFAMTIAADGNVGIGQTAPGQKLVIGNYDSVANGTMRITALGGQFTPGTIRNSLEFQFPSAPYVNSGDAWKYSIGLNSAAGNQGNYGSDFVIRRSTRLGVTDNVDFLIDGTTGSVGIGTTSPVSTWLNTFEPTTGNDTFKLTSEGWIVTPYLTGLAAYYPGQGARPIFWSDVNGTNIQSWDNDAADAISLRSSNGSIKLIVKEGGNVGIGTTSPSAKLDARGAIMTGSAAEDGNFSSTTANGMSVCESGSLQITQGWVGSGTNGDTVVFRYNATSWKSWGLEWNFMSTNGMSSGFIGGYNNNSTGHSKVINNNAHGITVSFSNSSQNNIITFTSTTGFGTHPMASFKYYQSGGDGRPYPSKASITMNS